MSRNLEKLQKLLRELFQLDQADLDFGIYRIMNHNRDEIVRFLENDLLPQVQEGFGEYEAADKERLKEELQQAIAQAKELGLSQEEAENTKKAQDLRQRIQSQADIEALEQEVYAHLYSFFRRYYQEGDFLSLRRYKEGVYAIPYEGEEVKLHWANADQYYIKTSEHFRNYAFKLPSERRVRFEIVAATTERDNNKAPNGKERRFILCDAEPAVVEQGELVLRFEYRVDEEKHKQEDLNQLAAKQIMALPDLQDWQQELAIKDPTEKNPDRTILDKHLTDFTAKNTFDYFIHKDLGKFLRRELDFYLKSDVIRVEDLENESPTRLKHFLSKVKVLRSVANKIITFLAQIEDFQKKLWIKRKIVLETQYCITVGNISEDFYPQIVSCEAQWEEWKILFHIDEGQIDLFTYGKSQQDRRTAFLKVHPTLVLDTKHFSRSFVNQLLASFDNLDGVIDGLLVKGENLQALNFLYPKYSQSISCIYIDPPYNTDAAPICYKNGYRNSSWISLVFDRLEVAKKMLNEQGVLCVTIDDSQQRELHYIVDQIFGAESIAATVVIRSNPSGRPTQTGFALAHEYAIFAKATNKSSIRKMIRSEKQEERYTQSDEEGVFEWRNFRRDGSDSERSSRRTMYYPIYVAERFIRIPSLKWNEISEEWIVTEQPKEVETVVYPIDDNGVERRWRWKHQSVTEKLHEFEARLDRSGKPQIYKKYRPNPEGVVPSTVWVDPKYSSTEHGTGVIKHLFGINIFSYPKSVYAVEDCITLTDLRDGTNGCLDFFAGSGTTGHAVIRLNQQDGNRRKFWLVEMGNYFDTVLLPRIKKVTFSPEWKDGQPSRMATEEEAERSPRIIKYLCLESYEDALNNIKNVQRTQQQELALEQNPRFREEYLLSYKLEKEAEGSVSLLNSTAFIDPFSYLLKVIQNDDTRYVTVDLVETFNYLLGLTVQRIRHIENVRLVQGMNRNDQRVLILWRNLEQVDNDALDNWFIQQGFNSDEPSFDLIYINGDNNLENLRPANQTWRSLLIDAEFQRLMFDIQEV